MNLALPSARSVRAASGVTAACDAASWAGTNPWSASASAGSESAEGSDAEHPARASPAADRPRRRPKDRRDDVGSVLEAPTADPGGILLNISLLLVRAYGQRVGPGRRVRAACSPQRTMPAATAVGATVSSQSSAAAPRWEYPGTADRRPGSTATAREQVVCEITEECSRPPRGRRSGDDQVGSPVLPAQLAGPVEADGDGCMKVGVGDGLRPSVQVIIHGSRARQGVFAMSQRSRFIIAALPAMRVVPYRGRWPASAVPTRPPPRQRWRQGSFHFKCGGFGEPRPRLSSSGLRGIVWVREAER